MSLNLQAIDWDFPAPFMLGMEPKASDIDGLNHVNNAVYLQWCEQVAWAHSEQLGLCLDDYRRLDRAMAIRRGEYDYILPALLGDELVLATWLTASDGKLTMTRSFQLVRASDRQTLMRGHWNLVCIELSSGKVRRMPIEFCEAYNDAVVVGSTASTASLT
jgi:acyl-CoA thioester hydrolase